MSKQVQPQLNELSYKAGDYLRGSAFEAWKTGPESPQVWIYTMRNQWGEGHEGWPVAITVLHADGKITPLEVSGVFLRHCYRCSQPIWLPFKSNSDAEFCEVCWIKMLHNTTLRGMRQMLLDLGADRDKVDEMWMLNGREADR
jgi:hypothetical protein